MLFRFMPTNHRLAIERVGRLLVSAFLAASQATACSPGEAVTPSTVPQFTLTVTATQVPVPSLTPPAEPRIDLVPEGAIARYGNGSIEAVAWSPDGTRLAVATSIGMFVYQADTLAPIWATASPGWLTSVAWSPDGAQLASTMRGGGLIMWNAVNGQPTSTVDGLGGGGWIVSSQWSPNGTRLAFTEDGEIVIWSVAEARLLHVMQEEDHMADGLAWSPDGTMLATSDRWGGREHSLELWETSTGVHLRSLTPHVGGVYSVAWSPDGTQLATGGWGAAVSIFDVTTGERLVSYYGDTSGTRTIDWSPDGEHLVVAFASGRIRTWDVDTEEYHDQQLARVDYSRAADYSPDGTRLATWSDGALGVWELGSGERIALIEPFFIHLGNAYLSPDWTQLVASTSRDTAAVLDLTTGHILGILEISPWGIGGVWSPDNRQIASRDTRHDRTLEIWDVESVRVVRTLPVAFDVNGLAWSPDGVQLALIGWEDIIEVWDIPANQSVWRVDGGDEYGAAEVAWSANGELLATGAESGVIKVWDAATGTLLRVLEGHASQPTTLLWSPDGTLLASTDWDGTLIVWNTFSGRMLYHLTGADWNSSLAWSPDGTLLALGNDHSIDIYGAMTGEVMHNLADHTSSIDGLFWSPHGDLLALGNDGSIVIFDAMTGEVIRVLAGHTSSIDGLFWSPDGNQLASISGDGSMIIWLVDW